MHASVDDSVFGGKQNPRNSQSQNSQNSQNVACENGSQTDKVSAATQIATKKLLKTKNLICFFKLIIRKQY